MTPGQKKTTAVLLAYCAMQVLGAIALVVWETYALSLEDHAAITTVVRLAWAAQPGAILCAVILWVGGWAMVFGHVFWGGKR